MWCYNLQNNYPIVQTSQGKEVTIAQTPSSLRLSGSVNVSWVFNRDGQFDKQPKPFFYWSHCNHGLKGSH